MWRTLLLGKLAVSITASLVVGGYCLYLSQDQQHDMQEMFRWVGIGSFFILLSGAQAGVIWMLFRKRNRPQDRSLM